MTHYLKTIMIYSILLAISTSIFAQVTIGSNNSPNLGALLDLKEENNPTGGATASKGLGMPRVKLLSLTITNPLTGVASTIDGAPTNELWNEDEHIGLMVYHIDDCTLNGKGLYAWTGDTWTKLSNNFELAGLHLSTDNLLFYNGINTPQDVTVRWKPISGYTPPTYTGTGATFTFNPLSGTLPATSPQTVSISLDNMTENELNTNLFANKTSTVTFSFANSPCVVGGGSETQTININQVNKALKVNGKVIPDPVDITATGSQIVTLESNAKWKFTSISPTINGAVTSAELGATKGTELEDGNAVSNTITYTATSAANLFRYNYLTFSDADSPERFADVILTVAQCAGNNDLTMRQYVDLWENTFGVIPGVDEPNSDGDITKNTRSVRWHYTRPDLPPNDPKQSIYFSAFFGTGRFMITNLQTKTYTPRTATPTVEWAGAPDLVNTYYPSPFPYTAAFWGYPNIDGTTNAALTTQYDARERLGLLYNWAAASGNENPSTSDQYNTMFTTPIQGICPAGWHLPSSAEWNIFLSDISANPTQYSTNTATGTFNAGITLKDMCEPYGGSGRGKSFSLFDGGFNALLTGSVGTSQTAGYGYNTYLWSASSQNPDNAFTMILVNETGLVLPAGAPRGGLYTVRCMQD